MINFERFIARGNFKVEEFFAAAGIDSDEQLREYCRERGMTLPVKEYFSAPVQPALDASPVGAPPTKPKRSTKRAPKPKAEQPAGDPDVKSPVKKPARKPRTTRRKTAAKKTQDK